MNLALLVACLALFVAGWALLDARHALKMDRVTWKHQCTLFDQMMAEAKFSSLQREQQWAAMYQLNTQHQHLVQALKGSMLDMGPPRSAESKKPN